MKRSRELKVGRITLKRPPGHYIDFEEGYDRLDVLCPEGIFAFYPYTRTTEANTVRYASAQTMAMRAGWEARIQEESIAPSIFDGSGIPATRDEVKINHAPPSFKLNPVDKKPDNDYLGNIQDQYKWEF